MENYSRKKKNIIALIYFSIILLVGILIGILLHFNLSSLSFLYVFLISFPFSILTYLTFIISFIKIDKNIKGGSLFILYIIRFIFIILSFLLSILYLYLNNLTSTNEMFYIIITPALYTLTYILVLTLK